MPARKVLKRPAAAKKRPSSGKSGKSGWATYRAKEELARIRTENELRQLKKERAELQSPPLGLNAAFISAVKKEELQKDPADLAAIQKDHPAEELPAIQNVKEELSEEFAAIQTVEEELSLQDTAVQTTKNWTKELSKRNLKILSTRPRYINGVSPLDSPPPRRFRRAPSLDPKRCTFPPLPCSSASSNVQRLGSANACKCTTSISLVLGPSRPDA